MNKWLKLSFVIIFFASISVGLFFLLKHLNILNIPSILTYISNYGEYSYIIYTIITIIVLVAFCFIPLLNTSLVVLGITLFSPKIAFITNIIAILFSTSILYLIGDKCGEKFASKLVGKKNLEETQNKLDHKSKFWLPILFMSPGIPDEAICLVAGMTKMKYWYILLVSLIYHSIEIGLFCFFGSSLINWSALTLIDWIVVINLALIDLCLLIKLEKFLENLKQRSKND